MKNNLNSTFYVALAALAQMVACLPLVEQVRGSIPGGVVNFHLKIFNLGARRGGDVHFLIARLYTHVHKWLPEINKTMFTPPPRSHQ